MLEFYSDINQLVLAMEVGTPFCLGSAETIINLGKVNTFLYVLRERERTGCVVGIESILAHRRECFMSASAIWSSL